MKRKGRVTVVAVGLAVLAVLGLVLFWPQAPFDASLTVPAAPPARLVCYGHVDTRQGVLLLQPARAGRVIQVFVKEKQTVSKDTPLLQLDDCLVKLKEREAALAIQAAQLQLTKARDGVKQYQARQTQTEAALDAANSKVLAAQQVLDRKEDLAKKQLVSDVDVVVARAQLNEARALVKVEQNRLVELKAVDLELEVKLAQLQLDHSESQLNLARRDREEFLLHAPMGGLVLRVQAQEGDLVGPSSPRPVVWLAPAGAWIVRAEVPQEFAGRVREGLDVQVEDEASAGLLAKGTIAEVTNWFLPRRQLSPLPTSNNTGLTLECVIELGEQSPQLRFGQRVRVRILADQPGASSTVSK
jgi:multidrug resistance efflux pump